MYLPVVEDRQSEGLSLCVRAQVGLEAERVDGRDKRLDGVKWRPWNWCILGDVTPVPGQTQEDIFLSVSRISQMIPALLSSLKKQHQR